MKEAIDFAVKMQATTGFDLIGSIDGLCKDITELARRKNSDYTGDAADPFKNFRLIEFLRPSLTAEDGVFVRMTDKIARIAGILEKGTQQVNEDLNETYLDLAVYSLIVISLRRAENAAVMR